MTLLSSAEAQQIANTAILRQLTEGVIVTDVVGTIKFVNDAAAALHGVAELNVRPNAYADAYHLYTEDGRPYPSHELPLARAVRGETVKNARWRIRRPDGSNILAIGNAQPLYGPAGNRIGAVLTLRDDTARDASERTLRAKEASLREVIERLTKRAEDAEAASNAKTESVTEGGLRIGAALDDLLRHAEGLVAGSSDDELKRQSERVTAAGAALKVLIEALSTSPQGVVSQPPVRSSLAS